MADEAKAMRKELHKLTEFVKDFLTLLDHEMKKPSSAERSSRVADLANKLQFKNDYVRRFALNLDFNGKPLKRTPLVNKQH
jgi:hypothetical protein